MIIRWAYGFMGIFSFRLLRYFYQGPKAYVQVFQGFVIQVIGSGIKIKMRIEC